MTEEQFKNSISQLKGKFTHYANTGMANSVGPLGRRLIDSNFSNQGFESSSWPARSTRFKGSNNKLLIKTGALRRSIMYSSPSAGKVRWYTEIPYARVHNEGFKGTVNVKAYTR